MAEEFLTLMADLDDEISSLCFLANKRDCHGIS